jgi:hypothetical protein
MGATSFKITVSSSGIISPQNLDWMAGKYVSYGVTGSIDPARRRRPVHAVIEQRRFIHRGEGWRRRPEASSSCG